MKTTLDYVLGLCNLVYVLIKSDEDFSEDERAYLEKMRVDEGISQDDFEMFMVQAIRSKERECYETGIHHISLCSREEQLRAFVWMHRMAYADGKVSPKEVRLLLYAVKRTHVTIDEVIAVADKMVTQ